MAKDVEMTADFDREQTPVPRAGTCFRAECSIDAVEIVAPAPGSVYEAKRLPTCISSKRGGWALCASTCFLRLGDFELYFGPDRREAQRIPFDVERRRPQLPPRQDDQL